MFFSSLVTIITSLGKLAGSYLSVTVIIIVSVGGKA